MEFEFDPAKSASNKDKHGLDFIEAQALWQDDNKILLRSRYEVEVRHLLIGVIGTRHWSAIFTMRGERVRLISVRRSRESEVRLYEEQRNAENDLGR